MRSQQHTTAAVMKVVPANPENQGRTAPPAFGTCNSTERGLLLCVCIRSRSTVALICLIKSLAGLAESSCSLHMSN
eukprot:4207009-Amphidinium_carterae.1